MADTEAKKILTDYWAEDGDRFDPEQVGITRANGWTVAYEQIGSGFEPERDVFAQNLREIHGVFGPSMRFGGRPPWDPEIDYYQYARAIGSDNRKYVAAVATGPRHGNVTDPTVNNQDVWILY